MVLKYYYNEIIKLKMDLWGVGCVLFEVLSLFLFTKS